MRLSFYGKDRASEENLGIIRDTAQDRDHNVTYTNGERADAEKLLNPKPHVFVTGLSCVMNFDEEIKLGEQAVRDGIYWLVCSDTYRSWARPWAKSHISSATVVVASPREMDEAEQFGFQRAVHLGGLPSWRNFLQLKPVDLPRNSTDEKLLLVPGCTLPNISNHILREVIAACRNVFPNRFRIIFKRHPYELPEPGAQERRNEILDGVPQLSTDIPTNPLILSVDCSVFNPGAVGTTIAALHRRPTICFQDDVTNAQLEERTGSSSWFPAEAGACLSANRATIRRMLLRACSEEGARELATQQAEVHPAVSSRSPRPESNILDFLESKVL